MVNTYRLVNPHIEGSFKSKMKARNSNEAGNLFYKSLSEHFNNSVHKFYFTIQKGSSGDGGLYHFEVSENRDENQVDFSIKPYTVTGGANEKEFLSKLENFKAKFNQDGGKKKKGKQMKKYDDSDLESSDSDNFYTRVKSYVPVTQPIYYYWYDPYVYRIDSLYVPTFYSYVTPYIELNLKL